MKRGASGLSLVVGVDKPVGMTSHDVVSRCRAVFGEKRVGHAGTLDPLASGVLPVMVGPASRLDAFMVEHDKVYEVRIAFGASTTTDDAEGDVVRRAPVRSDVFDRVFAEQTLAGFLGASKQMPPVYSAIKVDGRKACDEVRRGRIIHLDPRDIEVFSAELLALGEDGGAAFWDVRFHVSKGTYIRALARDVGNAIGVPAHVAALRRLRAGRLGIEDCVALETLADVRERAAIDPVKLLGLRFFYANDGLSRAIENGTPVPEGEVELFAYSRRGALQDLCACTSGVRASCEPARAGELFCVIAGNRLKAMYEYDADRARYAARCVFQIGVSRGTMCDRPR